jgi:uncharacterized protein YjiS (DUF1127 family)
MTSIQATVTFGRRGKRHPASHGRGFLGGLLARMGARRRQRRALAALDDRLLRDIGLPADAARAEAAKWFWRA